MNTCKLAGNLSVLLLFALPVLAQNVTIVSFGNSPNLITTTRNLNTVGETIETNLDLALNGPPYDFRHRRPFSETTSMNPVHADYDPTQTNAVFYGGAEFIIYGYSLINKTMTRQVVEGVGTNDYISFAAGMPGGYNGAGHEVVVWQRTDFLNAATTSTVTFDTNSVLTFREAANSHIITVRWVVKNASQYYVSTNSYLNPVAGVYSILPATNKWATYNPTSDLNFDQLGAFSTQTFNDVRAVGFYAETDSLSANSSYNIYVSAFSATACVKQSSGGTIVQLR